MVSSPEQGVPGTRGRAGSELFLSSQVLGFLFFAIACLLYKPPSESADGLGASLPSQSSASDNAMDLPDAPSALQPHSDV